MALLGLAFTMAEILLSLTIIGVVAAITLPSLTGNINERTWNTQRKALYARFSQAIALMPSLNGYGTLNDTTDTAAETFVTEGLAKVLKINNICDAEHLADCGITSTFTTLKGQTISSFPKTLADLNSMFSGSHVNSVNGASFVYNQTNTKAAAFETQNGESIVVYYNPNCGFHNSNQGLANTGEYTQPTMCANFVFDLNGNKGPNTFGKDMGAITALYPTDTVVVAPLPLPQNAPAGNQINAGRLCQQLDSESRLPNIEELSSMFFNRTLWGLEDGTNSYWSSTIVSADKAYYIGFAPGDRMLKERTSGGTLIRCIKR